MGDCTVCVAPDFRASSLVMGQWIIWIIKLVQNYTLTPGLHLHCQIPRPFHPLLRGYLNQLCSIGGHCCLALGGGIGGHNQGDGVSHHGGGHGQGNACIATGGFYQVVARCNLSPLLGTFDHIQCRPVLYRACRIISLQLGQNGIRGVAGQALQAHKPGVANGLVNGGVLHSKKAL